MPTQPLTCFTQVAQNLIPGLSQVALVMVWLAGWSQLLFELIKVTKMFVVGEKNVLTPVLSNM